MGNLGSIQNIIKKIGYQSEVCSDIEQIKDASKILLPGVGNFDMAMQNLQRLKLVSVIQDKVSSGTPLLGICLGMQLLANKSEEGKESGLGIIPGEVKKFQLQSPYKIPHMGWNTVKYNPLCALYKDFEQFEETRFYFVHSYHYVCEHNEQIAGTTNYGYPFTSSVFLKNVYGAQFHPEKSHKYGMLLLKNFIEQI